MKYRHTIIRQHFPAKGNCTIPQAVKYLAFGVLPDITEVSDKFFPNTRKERIDEGLSDLHELLCSGKITVTGVEDEDADHDGLVIDLDPFPKEPDRVNIEYKNNYKMDMEANSIRIIKGRFGRWKGYDEVEINLEELKQLASQPDAEYEQTNGMEDNETGYTTPYIQIMLEIIEERHLSKDNQDKKESLQILASEKMKGKGIQPSDRLAGAIATMVRLPESQAGRMKNFKKRK